MRVRDDPGGTGDGRRPRITVLYHFLHPDDVVSARHFDDLCLGLVDRGWDVTAMPSNRGCHDASRTYPTREHWRGVRYRRVWRPRFPQSAPLGRVSNASWMITSWGALGAGTNGQRPDVVLVGTDPPLSVLVAPVLRARASGVRIAHWVHDLYPEAPVADGIVTDESLSTRAVRVALRHAYGACDLIADLGPCMRRRIDRYAPRAERISVPPWALVESPRVPPVEPNVRAAMFGDARLAVLYSGNLGRAHGFDEFLALARTLQDTGVVFCFAVRGHRADELRASIKSDHTNVRVADFADESLLEARLAAADVHLASLLPSWTGVVVPSKFTGSLSSGRPVVFAGAPESALAHWIERYGCGWRLDTQTRPTVRAALLELTQDRSKLVALQNRCHAAYRADFSRERGVEAWDRALRGLL